MPASTLADLIDAPSLQSLMEVFYDLVGIPMAIIDTKGRVLVGVGWQDVCTNFHRAHPDTCKACIESDTELSAGVLPGTFRLYRCKNSMWDVATPILVGDRHVGNVFAGQFFFDDERVDDEVFREQARRFGFDEKEYLSALDRVPRLQRQKVNRALTFFVKLAHMVSHLGEANLKLAQMVRERDELTDVLRESEADLRRGQAVSRTGTWRLDVRRNALMWSTEAYRIFGVPEETRLSYEVFLACVHPEDRAQVDRAWQTALTDAPYDVDHRIVVGQEVRWVRERAELECDDEGRLLGGFGTVQDITERKQLESELRTNVLQLEEANRLKDEFLATLSHELRTPLNAILGWAHMLVNRRVDGEPAQRALECIYRNAQAQSRLVNDMLDVSRVVSGKLRLDLRQVDIGEALEAALDAVRVAAAAKETRLESSIDRPATLLGDADRLQQVFWNLLSNAVKFTPAGGRVSVALRRSGGQATVVVADTGVGIAPEFVPHLFQRFRQADGTTTRSHGGLGLGLAIVRHLVELHGGEVRAESEGVGRGATFTVTLPVFPAVQAGCEGWLPNQARSVADARPTLEGISLAGVRVLVVDDEADARDLVAVTLDGVGAETRGVATAREGLQMLKAWRPDVLISDISMPHEDGYWLIRQVRLLPADFGGLTPALALTAHGHPEQRAQALRSGFTEHLTKPTPPEDLASVVALLCSGPSEAVG